MTTPPPFARLWHRPSTPLSGEEPPERPKPKEPRPHSGGPGPCRCPDPPGALEGPGPIRPVYRQVPPPLQATPSDRPAESPSESARRNVGHTGRGSFRPRDGLRRWG